LSTNKIIEISKFTGFCSFPYIPNYLFIREGPIVMGSVESLSIKPDLILVNGHGIAHPRRAGLAVFVGLVLDTPTIGVAKSLLIGKINSFNKEVAFIEINGSIVGIAFKDSIKIYYLSPGHKITIDNLENFIRSDYIYSLMTLKKAHKLSKINPKES
jgi:deoxyribonuclease V